jgi:predicted Zn-dependent protease with MMP-like domain
MTSRRQRFDDLVLDSAARLEGALGNRLDQVEFAVEDVPPADPAPWEAGGTPLGRAFPAHGRTPARVVVYRRPVESRAESQRELSLIVQDIVVEQVAGLFGMAPEDLDPRYED